MNESVERVGASEKVVAGIRCAGDTAASSKTAQTDVAEQVLKHAEGVERLLSLLRLLLWGMCTGHRLRSDGLACSACTNGAAEREKRLAAEGHRAAEKHLEGVDQLGLLRHLRLRESLWLGCSGTGHCATSRSRRRGRRRRSRLGPLLPMLHGLQWLQGQVERIEQHVE